MMCGIAGIIGLTPTATAAAIVAMNAAMTHRGPDAEGSCVERFGKTWLGLGHRRLSIIDLSPLGNQPMWTADHSAAIVFNGEIYNFQALRQQLMDQGCSFRSGSDTEVLLNGLALHGREFINKLQGMYAFAYYDRPRQSLLLARDPAGIKPLFYARSADQFLFASEVRALLASGLVSNRISREAVAGFFAYGAVPQPLSVIDEIRMLDPGGTWEMTTSDNGLDFEKVNVWWSMPEPTFQGSADEAVTTTGQLLDDSVRDHLVADVPVGVFLSAGIDSTLIASLAHSHSKDVRAFTVALSEDREMDEMSIAADTAKRIGIDHVPVTMTEEDAEEAACAWLANADQPSIDGLNTFVISQAVRQHGIKVALSGLGADELFGGYPSFTEVPRIASFAKWLRFAPRSIKRVISKVAPGSQSTEASEKLFDMLCIRPSIAKLALQRRRLMNNRQMEMLGLRLADNSDSLWLPQAAGAQVTSNEAMPGWTISKMESTFYQGNMLLRDSDANSMAHSLEIRVPFLDQRLQDWIPTLPDSIRFPKGAPGKHLLRETGRKHLDHIHLRRPKTGFTLPIHRWMLGPMSKLCAESLEALKASTLVNSDGVDEIWKGFLRERTLRASSRALALIALGAYVKRQGSYCVLGR